MMTTPDFSPTYHARLRDKTPLAENIWRLRFARPEPTVTGLRNWDFRAGQYTHIQAADGTTRAYSIASGPQHDYIDLHIRDTGHGMSHALIHDDSHRDITLSAAQGQGLPEAALSRPLVLIAGGVGIAPVASLLDAAAAFHTPPHLYWGAETAADLYWHDTLADMAKNGLIHYAPLVTTGDASWRRGPAGPAVTADIPNLAGHAIYLSGPNAMIAATLPLLLRHNAEKAYIFGDGIGL